VARLKRGKKRRAIPNPDRQFMTLAEALVADEAALEATPKATSQGITVVDSDEDEESEIASEIEVKVAHRVAPQAGPKLPYLTTRSSDSLWIDVIYLGIASKLIDFRVGKVGGFLTVLVYSGGPKGGSPWYQRNPSKGLAAHSFPPIMLS
jgi:hypothetical protein